MKVNRVKYLLLTKISSRCAKVYYQKDELLFDRCEGCEAMKRVFISGSISIKKLPSEILESLNKIEQQHFEVLVGDAKDIDLLIQKKLKEDQYENVLVCSIYGEPRNLLSNTFKTCQVEFDNSIKSERKRQTFKDSYMTLRVKC